MIHQIYTVFDSKVAGYLRPFFAQTKGAAVRDFSDAVNDPAHSFNRHAEDYTLFELGTFDDFNCQFIIHPTPLSIGKAQEFINPTIPPPPNER